MSKMVIDGLKLIQIKEQGTDLFTRSAGGKQFLLVMLVTVMIVQSGQYILHVYLLQMLCQNLGPLAFADIL